MSNRIGKREITRNKARARHLRQFQPSYNLIYPLLVIGVFRVVIEVARQGT